MRCTATLTVYCYFSTDTDTDAIVEALLLKVSEPGQRMWGIIHADLEVPRDTAELEVLEGVGGWGLESRRPLEMLSEMV